MSKVDVLFKNYKFQHMEPEKEVKEKFDIPLFDADMKLSKLLKAENKTSFGLGSQLHLNAYSGTDIVESVFKKHPRNMKKQFLLSEIESCDSIIEKDGINSDFIESEFDLNNITKHFRISNSNPFMSDKLATSFNAINDIDSIVENKCAALKVSNSEQTQHLTSMKSKKKAKEIDVKKCKQVTKQVSIKQIPKNKPESQINCGSNIDVLSFNLSSTLIKISGLLEDAISTVRIGITPVNAPEDYIQRETRMKEFSTRFCRQYDYELSRQIMTLKTQISRLSNNKCNTTLLSQNISKTCSIIMQGISQYCIHLPTTLIIPNLDKKHNVHLKFYQLVSNIAIFFIIIKELDSTFLDINPSLNLLDTLDGKCKELMILIQNQLINPSNLSNKKVILPVKKPIKKAVKKEPCEKLYLTQPIETRLAMYSMSAKKTTNKNKHLNVQSRYRTAGIVKPNLPAANLEQKSMLAVEKKPSLTHKRSLNVLNNSLSLIEINNIKEDDIITMVQKDSEDTDFVDSRTSLNPDMKNKLENILHNCIHVSKDKEKVNRELMMSEMLNLIEEAQVAAKNSSKISLRETESQNLEETIDLAEYANTNISLTAPNNASYIFDSTLDLSSSALLAASEIKEVQVKKPDCRIMNLNNFHPDLFTSSLSYRNDVFNLKNQNNQFGKGIADPWKVTSNVSDGVLDNLLESVCSEMNITQVPRNNS